jgi:hypothetical protein
MEDKLNFKMRLLDRWPEPSSEMDIYGFLGTWLGQPAAAAAIEEAKEKGKATRTITYPLGDSDR